MVSEDIYSVSDYTIIQPNLFAFNRATQNQEKLTPTIEVNKQINIVGTNMDLSAIVFHCGESLTVGHYTSAVLVEGNWFMTDDQIIKPWTPCYSFDRMSNAFPYFAIYKKSGNLEVSTIPNITEQQQLLIR